MNAHKLAGKKAPHELLTNIPQLLSAYYTHKPDVENTHNLVSFGTSGHRDSSFKSSFNEDHVLAICQSICELRRSGNITGPLYVGKDTHALSEAAFFTAVEVFAANNIDIMIQTGSGYTPTPVISHAILTYNQNRTSGLADGVVIAPSHNPPTGGPADTETTNIIQNRANEILMHGLKDVKRMPVERALKADTTHEHDYVAPYVNDLENIIDMKAIASAGLKIGVDPMGGVGVDYWELITEKYGLGIEVVNKYIDPTFLFMAVDRDGKIRMDCSSHMLWLS